MSKSSNPIKKIKKGRKKIREPLFYDSSNCGNTHAYFIERSIELLKRKGRFGFIVPIALVSTDRMGSIRRFIHNNSSKAKYFNFDDRPGKIFSGLEDCRSTIVVTEKDTKVRKVMVSKYHRWFSEDRAKLFTDYLKTGDWILESADEIIPKIGTKVEKGILKKLKRKSKGKTLENFLEAGGIKILYHNAPRYWTHAHTEDYAPKVEYYEGYKESAYAEKKTPYNLKETKFSDQYKSLILNPKDSVIVNGLLNSSLFYWWYVIWSDGRHLLAREIKSFPINIRSFPKKLKASLKKLVDELMKSYDVNSNVKINQRIGGYVIKIKEIIPSRSKDIIDQIDAVFSEYFTLNEKEKSFIKEFDIEFRIKD